MRHSRLGLAGAALVGLAAFGAQPAQAQSFSFSFGVPGDVEPVPVYRPLPPPPPTYRVLPPPRRVHRVVRAYPGHVEPSYLDPIDDGPRCATRVTRYWDGWGWVTRRRYVCD
jgi:hypothetical protein